MWNCELQIVKQLLLEAETKSIKPNTTCMIKNWKHEKSQIQTSPATTRESVSEI